MKPLPPGPFDDEPTQPVPAPAGVAAAPVAPAGREELDRILAAAQALQSAGEIAELFAMLATTAPLALAEVTCGARALRGARVAHAALEHAAILERQLTPRGFYPRLAELSGEAAPDVLRRAAERHPGATWLVKLSRRVEGPRAGEVHLTAAAGHPSFAQGCVAHAEAGHIEGLLAAAARTGRAEPAAALVAVDPAVAARAGALALGTNPESPVVAHLAAAWGPEPDALVARVVSHLRSRRAAESLSAQARHLPHTSRLLRAVIPGLAG